MKAYDNKQDLERQLFGGSDNEDGATEKYDNEESDPDSRRGDDAQYSRAIVSEHDSDFEQEEAEERVAIKKKMKVKKIQKVMLSTEPASKAKAKSNPKRVHNKG